jgi:hypothetical protein
LPGARSVLRPEAESRFRRDEHERHNVRASAQGLHPGAAGCDRQGFEVIADGISRAIQRRDQVVLSFPGNATKPLRNMKTS